jgi:hypothetical protein
MLQDLDNDMEYVRTLKPLAAMLEYHVKWAFWYQGMSCPMSSGYRWMRWPTDTEVDFKTD